MSIEILKEKDRGVYCPVCNTHMLYIETSVRVIILKCPRCGFGTEPVLEMKGRVDEQKQTNN